jgi:hypothetical protein
VPFGPDTFFFSKSNTLTARFTYFPLKGNTSAKIGFIQVVKQFSVGGVDSFPGPGGDGQKKWDDYYAKLAAKGKRDFLDVKMDENPNSPYYGLNGSGKGNSVEIKEVNPIRFEKAPDPLQIPLIQLLSLAQSRRAVVIAVSEGVVRPESYWMVRFIREGEKMLL